MPSVDEDKVSRASDPNDSEGFASSGEGFAGDQNLPPSCGREEPRTTDSEQDQDLPPSCGRDCRLRGPGPAQDEDVCSYGPGGRAGIEGDPKAGAAWSAAASSYRSTARASFEGAADVGSFAEPDIFSQHGSTVRSDLVACALAACGDIEEASARAMGRLVNSAGRCEGSAGGPLESAAELAGTELRQTTIDQCMSIAEAGAIACARMEELARHRTAEILRRAFDGTLRVDVAKPYAVLEHSAGFNRFFGMSLVGVTLEDLCAAESQDGVEEMMNDFFLADPAASAGSNEFQNTSRLLTLSDAAGWRLDCRMSIVDLPQDGTCLVGVQVLRDPRVGGGSEERQTLTLTLSELSWSSGPREDEVSRDAAVQTDSRSPPPQRPPPQAPRRPVPRERGPRTRREAGPNKGTPPAGDPVTIRNQGQLPFVRPPARQQPSPAGDTAGGGTLTSAPPGGDLFDGQWQALPSRGGELPLAWLSRLTIRGDVVLLGDKHHARIQYDRLGRPHLEGGTLALEGDRLVRTGRTRRVYFVRTDYADD